MPPFGQNRRGPKIGGSAPFGEGAGSSYTSQSIAVVTTATFIPVYLFIARQSRDRMSGVLHQNLIGYISAISKLIHFWFSPKLSAVQGLQS